MVVNLSDENAVWQVTGNAVDVQKKTNKELVLQAVKDLVELGETPSNLTIARHVDMDTGNINRLLQTLLSEGKIVRGEKKGKVQPYVLAGTENLS